MNLAVIDAHSYQREIIDKAIDDLFGQLGGITNIVPQGKRVYLKVNLVRDMAPDKCGTTHPEIVRAVASKLIKECNATVTVGDSSGGAYTKNYMSTVYRTCKMDWACEQSGAQLNMDFDYCRQDINGQRIKLLDITNSYNNADVVINIGKLKSHSFTGYTGAVKNLFGLVPGLVKVEMHSRYPSIDQFVDCLIDIERFASAKILLHIIDAVMGMEGQGPTNGNPRFMGKIIASPNAYLADCAGVSLFDNPLSMPLLKRAVERDIIPQDYTTMTDFDFDTLKSSYIADFDSVVVLPTTFLNMPRWMAKLLKNNLSPRVQPDHKICRGCNKCVTHCPAKAMTLVNHKATVTQKKCIRCYCCQELCPFNAIKMKKPIVYRVVRGLSHTKNKKDD
ncbi:MAG: DUF362 domain-containing protein [Clostridia bacterium]|nr:DUF362 domain-containing protein [Clostridia bacterium]